MGYIPLPVESDVVKIKHLSQSFMMMGSKLTLEQLRGPGKGAGATFHWSGKVMEMPIDITETVTKWIANKEKVWETIGFPRMIILGWYRMSLKLTAVSEGTLTSLQIEYTRPDGWFYKVLSFFFAGWYSRWCLNKMLSGAKKEFEKAN